MSEFQKRKEEALNLYYKFIHGTIKKEDLTDLQRRVIGDIILTETRHRIWDLWPSDHAGTLATTGCLEFKNLEMGDPKKVGKFHLQDKAFNRLMDVMESKDESIVVTRKDFY